MLMRGNGEVLGNLLKLYHSEVAKNIRKERVNNLRVEKSSGRPQLLNRGF